MKVRLISIFLCLELNACEMPAAHLLAEICVHKCVKSGILRLHIPGKVRPGSAQLSQPWDKVPSNL